MVNTTDNADFIDRISDGLISIFGKNRFTKLIVTEASIFYYALLFGNKTNNIREGKSFSYHIRSGYGAIVSVFFFLIAIETFSLHLVLLRWSNTAAWILTSLSIYGIIFLFADFNAARRRPILVDDNTLYIRIGFRWQVCIPISNISRIEIGTDTKGNDKNYFKMVLIGSENVMIKLKTPVKASGLYGMSRTFSRLGLSIDNKEEFINLLNSTIKQQTK